MAWELANIQIFPNPFSFGENFFEPNFLSQKTCINYKEGRCSLTSPEKVDNACLDFEDTADFLRLKADAVKGTLS